MSPWRHTARIGALLLVVALLATFRDVSLTWDQSVDLYRRLAGPTTWRFWFGGFHPTDALWSNGHNPSTSFLFYAVWRLLHAVGLPVSLEQTWTLCTGAIALGGVVLLYRLVQRILPHAGDAPPLLAAATLALWPLWVGHGLCNFKDAPFAVAWLLATATAADLAQRPTPRAVIRHALAFTLLLVVRIGGLLFGPISALAFAVALWRSPGARRPLVIAALGGAALVLALHTLSYPYVLLDPLGGMHRLLGYNVDFEWVGTTLTAGLEHRSDQAPFAYLPVWLAVTLPEAVLAGLAVAPLLRWAGLRDAARQQPFAALVWASLAWSLVYLVLGRAPIYDGIRHALFVVPLLVALAVVALVGPRARLPRRAGIAVLVAGLAWNAVETVRFHPLQLTWFNALVGGTRGAEGRFTIDYWAVSARESAEWLAAHRAPGPLCVLVGIEESWQAYLPPPWRVVSVNTLAECPSNVPLAYVPSRNRQLLQARADAGTRWTTAYTVSRGGAALGEWFERRRPAAVAHQGAD